MRVAAAVGMVDPASEAGAARTGVTSPAPSEATSAGAETRSIHSRREKTGEALSGMMIWQNPTARAVPLVPLSLGTAAEESCPTVQKTHKCAYRVHRAHAAAHQSNGAWPCRSPVSR